MNSVIVRVNRMLTELVAFHPEGARVCRVLFAYMCHDDMLIVQCSGGAATDKKLILLKGTQFVTLQTSRMNHEWQASH